MRSLITRLCLGAALLVSLSTQAAPPRPFVDGSLQTILGRHAGQPFILGFWSLSCTHCGEELAQLRSLTRKYPYMKVVLVSTDTPEDTAAIEATLRDAALDTPESWVFADPDSDRLRYRIDPRWYGELPRTYLYEKDGSATAYSGTMDATRFEHWIRSHQERQ